MQQAVFRKQCSLTPGTARRVVLGRQHVLHQTTLTRLPSTYIQSAAKEEALVGSTSDSDACEPFNIQQELSNGSLARKAGGMLRDSKRQFCARAVADMHRLSAFEPIGMVLFTAYLLGAVASYLDLPGPAWVPALTGAGMGTLFAALNRYYKVRVHAPPDQPLGVVLTGGSKGLGKALARELLLGGDRVLLTSRTQAGADEVVRQLKEELGEEAEVWGVKCDVSSAQDVKGLQQAAVTHLGRVDVWLNNAGYSGSFQPFIYTEVEQLQQVVSTNLLGVALCSREAARLFASQPEGGHLFNVDGAGADGFATPNYAAYGATKAGIRHLSLSLQAELKHTNTHIHLLSPGMILTDLLLEGATPQNKQAFNILCEHPEVTAAFLAPRIRSVVARGARNTYVQYLTPASALWRFLTAPARMGKYFDAEGNPVYPEELERMYGPKHAKATARKLHHHRRQNQGLQVAYSLSLAAAVCLMLLDAAAMNGGALRG